MSGSNSNINITWVYTAHALIRSYRRVRTGRLRFDSGEQYVFILFASFVILILGQSPPPNPTLYSAASYISVPGSVRPDLGFTLLC